MICTTLFLFFFFSFFFFFLERIPLFFYARYFLSIYKYWIPETEIVFWLEHEWTPLMRLGVEHISIVSASYSVWHIDLIPSENSVDFTQKNLRVSMWPID